MWDIDSVRKQCTTANGELIPAFYKIDNALATISFCDVIIINHELDIRICCFEFIKNAVPDIIIPPAVFFAMQRFIEHFVAHNTILPWFRIYLMLKPSLIDESFVMKEPFPYNEKLYLEHTTRYFQ